MLGSNLCRKHLIKAIIEMCCNPLIGPKALRPLCQGRSHLHHLIGHIKDNGCLCSVSRSTVNLWGGFPISKKKVQCYSRSKLALSIFLRYFNIGCSELPCPISLYCAEYIPYYLFLPWQQLEGLSCPSALGMAQALDETNSKDSLLLIII